MKKLRRPPQKQKLEMPDFEAILNPTAPEAKSQPDVPKKPDLDESVYRTRRRVALACLLGAALLGGTGLYVACGPDDDGSADVAPKPKELVPGSKFMEAYVEEKDSNKRNMMVLDMVAKGNMPSYLTDPEKFAPIEFTGPRGTVVKFKASKSPLRIGNDHDFVDVPLDGPTAQAAAEILGYTLSTPVTSDKIAEEAFKNGGYLRFIAIREIAVSLGKNTDQHSLERLQLSPEAVQQRNILMAKGRKDSNIQDDQLVAGYFKDIVHPVRNRTREENGQYRLEIYGGQIPAWVSKKGKYYCKNGLVCTQPFSGGKHEVGYEDYSHGVRFLLPTIKVNGENMSLTDFLSNVDYVIEFGAYIFPEEYNLPENYIKGDEKKGIEGVNLQQYVNEHKKKPASE